MKLLIEHWGVIESAEVDLSKPLIVFTGPNGTGKTYISYLLYGVLASFGFFPYMIIEKGSGNKIMELFQSSESDENGYLKIELNPSLLFKVFNEILDNDWSPLTRYLNMNESTENLGISITSSEQEWTDWFYNIKFHGGKEIDITKESQTFTCFFKAKTGKKPDMKFEIAYLLHTLFFEGVHYPYMLTAERTGIYTFSKELSLGRLRNPEIAGRYPAPISDSLANAEDLAASKKIETNYAYLADEIERDILHGKLNITDEGEIFYQYGESSIPYNLASSMIKTLSPIIFYLRHKAYSSALLIIDEPEINLHPNNQVVLARVFARMINAGLHLLIATHSDYIIRELNNLVMLSELREDKLKEYNYKNNEKLNRSQMQPYYFDFWKDTGKVKVLPIEVTKTGFDVVSIDDTIEQQNSISQELYFDLNDESSEFCE